MNFLTILSLGLFSKIVSGPINAPSFAGRFHAEELSRRISGSIGASLCRWILRFVIDGEFPVFEVDNITLTHM